MNFLREKWTLLCSYTKMSSYKVKEKRTFCLCDSVDYRLNCFFRCHWRGMREKEIRMYKTTNVVMQYWTTDQETCFHHWFHLNVLSKISLRWISSRIWLFILAFQISFLLKNNNKTKTKLTSRRFRWFVLCDFSRMKKIRRRKTWPKCFSCVIDEGKFTFVSIT